MQPGSSRRKQKLRSTIPPGYTQGNTPCGIREMPVKEKAQPARAAKPVRIYSIIEITKCRRHAITEGNAAELASG